MDATAPVMETLVGPVPLETGDRAIIFKTRDGAVTCHLVAPIAAPGTLTNLDLIVIGIAAAVQTYPFCAQMMATAHEKIETECLKIDDDQQEAAAQ